jgi:hypothetical protein
MIAVLARRTQPDLPAVPTRIKAVAKINLVLAHDGRPATASWPSCPATSGSRVLYLPDTMPNAPATFCGPLQSIDRKAAAPCQCEIGPRGLFWQLKRAITRCAASGAWPSRLDHDLNQPTAEPSEHLRRSKADCDKQRNARPKEHPRGADIPRKQGAYRRLPFDG